jgi:cytochrome P450
MPIPAHVPPELVKDYPYLSGIKMEGDAFGDVLSALHQGPPAFFAPGAFLGNDTWVFRRAADLHRIYQDVEHFSNHGFTNIGKFIGEDWGMIPSDLDPPELMHFRTLLAPLFTPKKLFDLDDRLHDSARRFLATIKPGDDFLHHFADVYPVAVFLDLLGLPQERMREFIAWMFNIMHGQDETSRQQTVRELKQFFIDEFDARRRKPTDDLLSVIVHAQVDGRALTELEMVGIAFNLYLGGLDTVSAILGLQVRYLAENPEHQAMLRADLSLIPKAVEELNRAFSPATTFRVCKKEAELAGVRIMPGDHMALPTPLAARDPEAFENPNKVDFDRVGSNITFATGPHRCLGIHVARREVIVGLTEVLSTLPPFRIVPGAKIRTRMGFVIGLESLPLTWDA